LVVDRTLKMNVLDFRAFDERKCILRIINRSWISVVDMSNP